MSSCELEPRHSFMQVSDRAEERERLRKTVKPHDFFDPVPSKKIPARRPREDESVGGNGEYLHLLPFFGYPTFWTPLFETEEKDRKLSKYEETRAKANTLRRKLGP